MRYTLRRWWRRLMLARRRSRAGDPGPVVADFLAGASARECAYTHWYRGASADLVTAADWPAAVSLVESLVRSYALEIAEQLEEA